MSTSAMITFAEDDEACSHNIISITTNVSDALVPPSATWFTVPLSVISNQIYNRASI